MIGASRPPSRPQLRRSLGRKVRALGLIQVVTIAAIMALLGVLFFSKMVTDQEAFRQGTRRVKRAEAEGLAKLLALELGRLEPLRNARRSPKDRGLTPQQIDAQKKVRAVLWEKKTFIGVVEELDLIAEGADGALFCLRPMGVSAPCAFLEELEPRFDSIDRLQPLRRPGEHGGQYAGEHGGEHPSADHREGEYVLPLYVSGSFWGLLRMKVSESEVEELLRRLSAKNAQDLVTAVVVFVVCFLGVAGLLYYLLSSFFGRIHGPLLALTEQAVAFGEDPEATAELGHAGPEADPEDEIGVLSRSFGEMQVRLVQTLAQKDAAMAEMREKDEQLRRSERMASVGVLAATVAHEIGNKLNPMGFAVHNIRRRVQKGKPIGEQQLEVLAKGIESATAILDKLRSTARPSDDALMSLNGVLEDVEMFLGNQVRSKGIVFDVVAGEPLPLIMGHRAELVQVVLNLVKNAREALDDQSGERRIEVRTAADEGGGAVLSVSDTGVGMDADTLRRIYEPGFSTKGLATGTGTGGSGLGLHVSYGILKRHGVEPEVHSALGQGTRFVMRFPAPDEQGEAAHAAEGGLNNDRADS